MYWMFLISLAQTSLALPLIGTDPTPSPDTTTSSGVVSQNGRTIWTILSTCMFTIFSCIYKVMHPNVPSPYDSPTRLMIRSVGCTLMTLVAPELCVLWAIRQLLSAYRFTTQMDKFLHPRRERLGISEKLKRRWNKVKTHFDFKKTASGDEEETHDLVRIRVSHAASSDSSTSADDSTNTDDPTSRHDSTNTTDSTSDNDWTPGLKEGGENVSILIFFAYMGGFMIYYEGAPWSTITPEYLLTELKDGNIDVVALTKCEVNDSSKGTIVTKGLAIWQIATLAFCVLCIMTYLIWLYKPQSVNHPRRINWKPESSPPRYLHKARFLPVEPPFFIPTIAQHIVAIVYGDMENERFRVATFGGSETSLPDGADTVGYAVAVLYGAIHLLAWNFQFPSSHEQLAWRCAALAIIGAPFCYIASFITFGEILDYLRFRRPDAPESFICRYIRFAVEIIWGYSVNPPDRGNDRIAT
ncbi:hypothetical protein CONPUDRAFT_78351 [Coniophora puteana RWD-64-598 SS2]|uniref:Uncharacterized protein n=1 Tax=Coniophora puteana (strain RWD-64-598) TaxID=741705 RepID=R7SDM5_CONPW|nr:uncharacterized protein CONPUDRAFT_78351 [Coniophora puteana RWD-64-598 SS2]EIW73980.1 hypothetical protein CONPUDRAFT_78351 [Coniophora puteana RWD-64-598 SS2]